MIENFNKNISFGRHYTYIYIYIIIYTHIDTFIDLKLRKSLV